MPPIKDLLIVWRELNRTEIPIIDEQHRGIVSIINSVHHAIGSKKDILILEPATETLMAYSRIHFATESELLEESKYPHLENHNKLHDKLIKDMTKNFIDSKKERDPGIMLGFLKDWWLNHINKEDMLYKKHLLDYLGLSK
ncbi:MAG: hemerythrin family protein [Deltaproteobacteria bacterium]|nr:hemerythrin family protein [Deltaproteobacteria bacterium]